MKNRTLLVTGGAGFIGSNFIRYWIKKYPDDKIINLDALTYAGNLDNLKDIKTSNYTFVHGDITDAPLVDKIVKDVDIIVHFAAESHVDRSIKDPDKFLKTNILGTHTLLKAAIKWNIKKFHHISTDEVFGSLDPKKDEKFTLETPYDPRSPYSASKASSDHLVRAYGETYGLTYNITNCSNNYGPYQFPEKLIPLAITNVLQNKKVPIYGTGDNIRDWLFVLDHVKAIDLVINHGKKNTTYLIGGLKKDITNLELIKLLLKKMNKSEDYITFIKDRPGHDKKYAIDWSFINKELGWEPSVTLEEGLSYTINWYKNNQNWWKKLIQKNMNYFKTQYEHNK